MTSKQPTSLDAADDALRFASPPPRPLLHHGHAHTASAASVVGRFVHVAPSRYVTIELFSTITGLSPGAIRKRIERGVYIEGKQFRRAPDGRVWMDTKGHEQWVEAATA